MPLRRQRDQQRLAVGAAVQRNDSPPRSRPAAAAAARPGPRRPPDPRPGSTKSTVSSSSARLRRSARQNRLHLRDDPAVPVVAASRLISGPSRWVPGPRAGHQPWVLQRVEDPAPRSSGPCPRSSPAWLGPPRVRLQHPQQFSRPRDVTWMHCGVSCCFGGHKRAPSQGVPGSCSAPPRPSSTGRSAGQRLQRDVSTARYQRQIARRQLALAQVQGVCSKPGSGVAAQRQAMAVSSMLALPIANDLPDRRA